MTFIWIVLILLLYYALLFIYFKHNKSEFESSAQI